jgi:Protein-tyrosine phosphatase
MTSIKAGKKVDIWWVERNILAGMSIPDVHPQRMSGQRQALSDWDDDLPALWNAGIRAICCLLNHPELTRAYAAAGFVCHELPLPEGGVPTKEKFAEFLHFLTRQRGLCNPVAVHCQAGIGRTGTLLAAHLVSRGQTPEQAISQIRACRPGAIDTRKQREFLDELYISRNSQLPNGTALIRPNRSVWVLPDGGVIDAEAEGRSADDAHYSHGIFVKKWIRFRLENFCPDPEEMAMAQRMKTRARQLLREHPDLVQPCTEEGDPNPYDGDLAFNQAAEEEGWVRIKPLTTPRDNLIYAESIAGKLSPAARSVIEAAASRQGCEVRIMTGGALANRAVIYEGSSGSAE